MLFMIFVQCQPGKATEVGTSLAKKGLPDIEEIYSISGEWDLMVRARFTKGHNFETDVLETIFEDQWEKIRRTQTVIAYRVYNPDDASWE